MSAQRTTSALTPRLPVKMNWIGHENERNATYAFFPVSCSIATATNAQQAKLDPPCIDSQANHVAVPANTYVTTTGRTRLRAVGTRPTESQATAAPASSLPSLIQTG